MIHDQFAIGCGVMWSRRAASCAFSIGDKAFFAGVRASTALSRTRVAIAPTCGQTLFRGPCGGGTRNMSFSFPGPRKLKDITNLPLLEKEPLEQIADIWSVYHEERTDTFGTSLPGDALKDLQSKAKRCPMFVLPVWRDNGHFMMLSQYQDTCFLLTFLEDYKVNPGGAQPYATISVYDDLVDSKGLGLIRADITPNLTKKEVARLVRLLIRFYSPHAHHHVEAFNLRPEEFDLDQLMKETPAE